MRSLLLLVMLAACGDDGSPAPVDAAADGPPIDVAPGDAGKALETTCTGACRTTNLTAVFGATTRQLDVAYFGISNGTSLYVEAYGGAAAGCPSMNSPTPDYTLIFGNLPLPTTTAMTTSPANLIDFQGDLLPSPAPLKATTVTLTPVAMNATELALEIELVFPSGTIAGHLFAMHCDSLDE